MELLEKNRELFELNELLLSSPKFDVELFEEIKKGYKLLFDKIHELVHE